IARKLGRRYGLRILSSRELVDYYADQVRRAFRGVNVLAGLILIIILVALADTLAGDVLERTRELGMLRAIGIAARHVRRIERVTKRYGAGASAVEALSEVMLDVPAGEFLSIVGPSGSGKSTLLNLVGGLDTPSAGRVFVEGQALAELSDEARSDLRLQKMGF